MSEMEKITLEELDQVAGGNDGSERVWVEKTVTGTKNFLAIRKEAKYDDANIIGKRHNGDVLLVLKGKTKNGYAYVYSREINVEGWANGSYLK